MSTEISNNNNNSEETSTISTLKGQILKYGITNMDDIRTYFIGSRLTVPIAREILTSEYKDEALILYYVFVNSIDLHSTSKISFLAAVFDLKMYEFGKTLLDTNKFTFVEILKCLKVMDSKRVIKKLEAKLGDMKKKNQERKDKLDKVTTEYVNTIYPNLQGEEKEKFLVKLLKNNSPFPTSKITTTTTTTTKKQGRGGKSSRGGRQSSRGGRQSSRGGRQSSRGGRQSSRGGRQTTRAAIVVGEEEKPIETTETTETTETNENNNNNNELNKLVIVLDQHVKDKMYAKKQKEGKLTSRLKKGVAFLENKISELKAHDYHSSLSGNVIKIFKRWIATVDHKTLEFFALGQPKETWQKLADIIHLGPKDFPTMPWFMKYMFGEPAPEGSIVKDLEGSETKTDEELVKLWSQYKPPYSFIRKSIGERQLTDAMRLSIAKYESLNTLIWWLHEFKTEDVTQLIIERLASGETVNQIALGTLIEKALLNSNLPKDLYDQLLTVTQDKLGEIQNKFSLPPPISIFSDKSGSMEVAIRLAIIISFMITKLTPDSSLSFFDTSDHVSPIKPTTINDIFILNEQIKASGGTTPAASLVPLINGKISKKYLVLVTDEEENGKVQGKNFAQLYKEYISTVNSECKLIFVSFLSNNAKGQMVTDIKKVLEIEPLQFVLDGKKPDVTKIDAMLSVLSAESSEFKNQFELLMKYNSLMGEKAFLKYVSQKKDKLLTYALNVEIVTDILANLYKYFKDEFTDKELSTDLKFFASQVKDKSNCLEIIDKFNQDLIVYSKPRN